MSRKVMRFISFVLVLALAGGASAATLAWDNGGEGSLWSVPENWEPDGIPLAEDTVQIFLPDANCVIDDSVAAECINLYVGTGDAGYCYLDMIGGSLTLDERLRIGEARDSNGVMIVSGGVINVGTTNATNGRLMLGVNGSGTLHMRGGEMNIYDKTEIGRNSGAVGILHMEGGTINFSGNSSDLELAKYGGGTGIVHMTGGTINLEDNIKLGQSGGSASIYLDGGVLNAGNLRNPDDGITGTPLIDITEGMLTLPGDYTAILNQYLENNWIVAYAGLGVVEINLEGDLTVVTASMLPPELASHPVPRNRGTAERPVVLSWAPGIYAVTHDVYFGTDFNDVNDATLENPLDVLVSVAQDANTFDPGELVLGQTYYWRIDEVNDLDPNSPYKGAVFQFNVASYIVVEDFELYNEIPEDEPGSNLVYYTWEDGYANPTVNGGTIGYLSGASLETETIHGGLQSVPLMYSHKNASYSEVTVKLADLAVGTDWTVDDVNELSLWFYGDSSNVSTEQMYVKLYGPDDIEGSKIPYDGEADNLITPEWHEWRVDLAGFEIDLSHVAKLGIGFERTAGGGASGIILLDDIRLYIAEEEEEEEQTQ